VVSRELLVILCILAPQLIVLGEDRPVSMMSGRLAGDEEAPLLAEVVRYGVKGGRPPCTNYGWKGGYCLSIRGQSEDPPTTVLKLLDDIRPPVRPASACRREGIIAARGLTTDPVIDVEWLHLRDDGSVEARVLLYCDVSQPVFIQQGKRWILKKASGWVGCGPVPGDCEPPNNEIKRTSP
jgi:hypothetical protein